MRHDNTRRVAHGLQFNVSQLLKETTGATRTYHVNAQAVDQSADTIKIVSGISGQVDFLRTGADILVTGRLETIIQKMCGRCLEEFTVPVTIELEEQFYPSVDILTGVAVPTNPDTDEANQIDERHILDLREVVRQNFLLAGEDARYCQPDCQGICPYCGQNRNLTPCNCADNQVDQRWANLFSVEIDDQE